MKKILIVLLTMLFFLGQAISQVMPQGYLVNSDVTTVTIGTQVWMKYNLDVTRYQNGDPIEGADIDFDRTTTTHAWCYYNHNANFNATYGKFYNGYAINDARNVCPIGFRVPTDADFNTLATYIGGAGNGYKLRQADPGLWNSPTTVSTDMYSFTALPAGYMGNANSSSNMFSFGYFWTSTPIPGGGSTNYVYYLSHNYGGIRAATTFVLEGGVSVR
jgi:uncharacterized protein (TIGR02145 family)